MANNIAAVEINSRSIKLVIGYVLNGQVHLIYTVTKELPKVVDAGRIINYHALVDALRELTHISDSSVKLNLTLSNITLALPPFGLEVFQTKQVTNVLSDDATISDIDIKNAYSLVRKCHLPPETELADIIPTQYVLDQGRTFALPPIGQGSSTLQVQAKIHALPVHIINEYRKACEEAGFTVKKIVVSPTGTIDLLKDTYPSLPQDFLLVDIGSDITTVSLVGASELFLSRFFSWGGNNITKHVMDSFKMNSEEAEKAKILYGLDRRELNFDPIIYESTDENGLKTKHTVGDLNSIIMEELDVLSKELNAAIDVIFEGYSDPKYKRLPMVLIGGGSQLFGLQKYLEPKIPSDTLTIITPNILGARHSSYFNCLGMIYFTDKFPNIYDDPHSKVGALGRDPKKEIK